MRCKPTLRTLGDTEIHLLRIFLNELSDRLKSLDKWDSSSHIIKTYFFVITIVKNLYLLTYTV